MCNNPLRIASVIGLLVLLAASAPQMGVAQSSHKSHYTGPLEFSYPKMSYFPPLSMGMPFDVLIGYVYLDSLARTVDMSVIDSAFGDRRYQNGTHRGAIGYSDTLRYLAKYLYEIDDFDPPRFSQYSHLFAPGMDYASGGLPSLMLNLDNDIARKFPDTLRTVQLCVSDYIVHVKVTGIKTVIDPDSSIYARTAYKVTCNILDLIKGQVIPACIPDTFTSPQSGKFAKPLLTPSCIQFDYRLEWTRLNHGDFRTSEDSTYLINGHPWIELDSEYVVYLQLQNLGYDSVNSYSTIFPSITASNMGGMYPVKGGVVADWYDDMGFGQGLTVTDYKTRLRAKIQSIIHP